MPLRRIIDAAGTAWDVWQVTAEGHNVRSSVAVASQCAAGWLAFEQVGERPDTLIAKRRLAPVPSDWDSASDEAVLAVLAAATPVRRRPRV